MKKHIFITSLCMITAGCAVSVDNPVSTKSIVPEVSITKDTIPVETQQATFAGGCFWCIESAFDSLSGVYSAVSGYTGGESVDPTYEDHSGHREAVLVTYDPAKVTYNELLEVFWRNIDPTDEGGQFADRGFSYTTAIYTHDEDQLEAATESKKTLDVSEKYDKPIATVIVNSSQFYEAEDYHQDFAKKKAAYYERYAEGSGRKPYIRDQKEKEKTILNPKKEMSDTKNNTSFYDLTPEQIEERLKDLDPLSYHVIAEGGTESPFNNVYWDNKSEGIYVDKVTGDPLFSSTHKYDSGTGWPSFHTTLQEESVKKEVDSSHGMVRTEIKSAKSDAHLGHVFSDGPEEHGGERFCTNSASLLFIPKDEMKEKGYGEWLYLFDKQL